jgi:uncharacterized protein (TIGR00255 family)
MISSMTGYGRAEKNQADCKIVVETSSVNNRFLEFQVRLPKNLMELEGRVKKLLSAKLHRGKIYFSVTIDNDSSEDGGLALDQKKADIYYKILSDLKTEYNLPDQITLSHFVSIPDLITAQTSGLDLEETWNSIEPVCLQAIDNLCKMRFDEGQNLLVDFSNRLNLLTDYVHQIKSFTKDNYTAYSEKLKKRIKELLAEVPIDEQRLAMETALMLDKIDITEEIIRLEAHFQSFGETLATEDAVGKRLNFILQEMNREANTIGSKSVDYNISAIVIRIKEELEKLREQSQNIE